MRPIPPHDRRPAPAAAENPARLRVLTFNIQVGLRTARYSHYLTRAWRHALPGPDSRRSLIATAEWIRGYDFVAIQEADAGSLRTRFLNQLQFLAGQAGYPDHGFATTRDLRPFAQHCLGFLSRWPARIADDHALPGLPGRRALHVEIAHPSGPLRLVVVHLALRRRAQIRQLSDIVARLPVDRPTVLLGDFNCEAAFLHQHPGLTAAGLLAARQAPPTYPSWAPRRSIDHILVSPGLVICDLRTLPAIHSDHLALAAEIRVEARPGTLP